MPRTQPAQQQAGVSSVSSSSSSSAVRKTEKLLAVRRQNTARLKDLCQYIAALPVKCTGKTCNCCKIPEVAYLMEKQHEASTLVEILDAGLHTILPSLATTVLKAGHSTRAFRRVTEAFDMTVRAALDPSASSWETDTSTSTSSSSSSRSSPPAAADRARAGSGSKEEGPLRAAAASASSTQEFIHDAKQVVAAELGKCGLLPALVKEAAQLRQQWEQTHAQLVEWVDRMGPSSSQPEAAAITREHVQQLVAAAAPINQASGLDRSQELYTWANMLISIWPSDVLAAPAAAGVVTAAAEVAAYHLQSMTDVQRANTLLTAQHRRPLPLPRLGGVAAAAELGKCLGEELVTYLPGTQQQQEELQAGREVDLPTEVERMLHPSYQLLLPLCATAIAFDGVHLAWLMDRKQQQEEKVQKLLDSATAAAAGAAAQADAAVAAGEGSAFQAVAAGSVASPAAGLPVEAAAAAEPGSSSPAGQETSAAAAVAAAAAATAATPSPPQTSAAAAAAAAGDCSPRSRASRRGPAAFPAAAAAAAAATEASLLLSAGQLFSQLPDWVSGMPAWGDLLKGSWADMGYTEDLHEEVHCAEYGGSDDSSSSSSSTCTSSSSTMSSSSDSSSASSSSSSSSSGSNRRGSSRSSDRSDAISRYLCSQGITRDTAYQLCVDACCTKWLENCQLLLFPLRDAKDDSPAATCLASLVDGQLAAAHVAQLPVLLLASAVAAVQLDSKRKLQVVAEAVEMTAQVCRHCEGLSWGISAGSQQQQDSGQQQQQQDSGQQQQQQDSGQQQQQQDSGQQQQQQQDSSQQQEAQAVWQVLGLVLQLLQQLLMQATQQLQQQEEQGQPGAAADSADMQVAIHSCLDLLHALIINKLEWDFNSLQDCQRLTYVLQLSEAALRYLAAAAAAADTQPQQPKQPQQGRGKKQGRAQAAANKGAGAPAAVCALLATTTRGLVDAVCGILGEASHCLMEAPSRNKCCRLQHQAQLLAQASLSLLLTVVKLPWRLEVDHSIPMCDCINMLLSILARPDGALPYRIPAKPLPHQPQRLLEPHPAAMALAGRFLMRVGTQVQDMVSDDPAAACSWLADLLLGPSTGAGTSSSSSSSSSSSGQGCTEGPEGGGKGPCALLLYAVMQAPHLTSPRCQAHAATASSSSRPPDGSSSGSSGASTTLAFSASTAGAVAAAVLAEEEEAVAMARELSDCTATELECLRLWRENRDVNMARLEQFETARDDLLLQLRQMREEAAGMRGAAAAKKRLSAKRIQVMADKSHQEMEKLRAAATNVPSSAVDLLKRMGLMRASLGSWLTNLLPTRFTCNNPHCTNISTTSEAFQLVRGKACACAGCLAGAEGTAPAFCFAARYCSVSCQAAHWRQHKPTCRLLRQSGRSTLQQGQAAVPEPAG